MPAARQYPYAFQLDAQRPSPGHPVARCAVLVVPNRPDNPFICALHEITEPDPAPFRRVIRRLGMFDLAPFATLLGIGFVAGQLSR